MVRTTDMIFSMPYAAPVMWPARELVSGYGFQARFPPAVAHRLLLSALTTAIESDPGLNLDI